MAADIMPWVWSTALVVLLLLGLLWGLRRWPMSSVWKNGRSSPGLKLLSSLSLGPQQRVVAVTWHCEGQPSAVYLLGVTPHQINCLQALPPGDLVDEPLAAYSSVRPLDRA
jgi:flagellar protein FliO/FliZ